MSPGAKNEMEAKRQQIEKVLNNDTKFSNVLMYSESAINIVKV